MNFGTKEVSDVYVGALNVYVAYFGSEKVWEKSSPPPTANWLCFTAEEANSTVRLDKNGSPAAISLETSTDGSNWTDYTWSGNTGPTLTLANVGDKVYMRAKNYNTTVSSSAADYYKFVMTGTIGCSGNIQTLLVSDGSVTTVPSYCYHSLFQDCTSLTTAPSLPATTLAEGCYNATFSSCSSLTTAPVLPAMTLANNCYSYMFMSCTSLTTAPSLPATTLAEGCYNRMFRYCSNLNTITLGYTGNFSSTYFTYWVSGVATSGTFYYNGSDTTTGINAIPSGWTVTPYTP